MKAIIFDLDGTLINSVIQFKEMKLRIIKYFEEIGITPGLLKDEMMNFELTSIAFEELLRKGFEEEQLKMVFTKVSSIMNEVELNSIDDATLMENVSETLRTLRVRGLKLGLITRSCHEYAEKILEKFGLTSFFEAIVARDDVEKPKPEPEHAFHLLRLLDVRARDTLYVGDHWSDAECANKANLKFIIVKKSEQDVDKLKKHGFKSVEGIKDILILIN